MRPVGHKAKWLIWAAYTVVVILATFFISSWMVRSDNRAVINSNRITANEASIETLKSAPKPTATPKLAVQHHHIQQRQSLYDRIFHPR